MYTIDLAALKPTVAFPHLPENTKEMGTFEEVKIDQVVIGSCTNGRIQDIRQAAEILKGRKVAKNVRCIVIPATQSIYLQAMREGLLEIFIEAGAVVTYGPCGVGGVPGRSRSGGGQRGNWKDLRPVGAWFIGGMQHAGRRKSI